MRKTMLANFPEVLSSPGYASHLHEISLRGLGEDAIVPASFLKRYCGWTASDVGNLRPSDHKINRFGSWGPMRVTGFRLGDALKYERTRKFRSDHPTPLSVSATGLKKEYHFTDRLISRYLGKPDMLSRNPRYASAAPTKLYRIGKLLMIRSRPEVMCELGRIADQREKRSSAARAAAARKAESWIQAFSKVKLLVDFSGLDSVAAIEQVVRRDRAVSAAEWKLVDAGTKARWCVNFLRHERTSYDEMLALDLPPGRAGERCYLALRERVMERIEMNFPDLAAECRRQLAHTMDAEVARKTEYLPEP